jgi:hypothetical protein
MKGRISGVILALVVLAGYQPVSSQRTAPFTIYVRTLPAHSPR